MTRKTAPPLKMTANKTFQVARNPQYMRAKPRSPLALHNERKSPIKQGSADHTGLKLVEQTADPKQRHRSLPDLERIHDVQKNSVVLLVPACKFVDSGNMPASLDTLSEQPENKELTKKFNKTLSPIGTPERFKKLMPRIQSDSALPASVKSAADNSLPSLNDALDVIGSDLIHCTTSPRETNSSGVFSDSLESNSDRLCCDSDKNALKTIADSSEMSESNQPRLTFFVNKKLVEGDKVADKVKKAFTSATVTKSKVPVETNSPGRRKVKKSRRRLLEKTLELSDGSSQCDSGPGTPSLPVIDTETRTTLSEDGLKVSEFMSSSPKPRLGPSAEPVSFPVSSPPHMAPSRFCFSASSPSLSVPAPATFTTTSPPPASSLSPLSEDAPAVSVAPLAHEDLFPVQLAVKSKKRKSEEYLKTDGKAEASGEPEQVKRSRVVVGKTKTPASVQKRRSVSQRQRLTSE